MKKKAIISLVLSLSLCGCQGWSLPETVVKEQTEVQELTLAIPSESTEMFREVARELSRRAMDFADNSLSIEIVEAKNIWEVLREGSADLAVCENRRALQDAESLGDLNYPEVYVKEEVSEEEQVSREIPQIRGEAAMFAMLDYPFFFRDGECIIGGGNNADVLAALNHSLPEDFGMELQRLSFNGAYHWVTNNYEQLESYLLEYSISDLIQRFVAQGEPLRAPWTRLEDEGLYIREVDLTNTKTDLSEKTLLLNGGRYKIIDIFANPESLSQLTAKQQAAIEEAIVYSGGYSKTLADDHQATILRQLEEDAVTMVSIDIDEWYTAFQKLYRSGSCEINADFAELLWDKTERFH